MKLRIAPLAVALVIACAATWFITRAAHEPETVVRQPAVAGQTTQTLTDFARQAVDAMFSFTPATVAASVKTSRAMLCGQALADYDGIIDGEAKFVANIEKSGATSGVVNDKYGVNLADARTARVVVLYDQAWSSNDAEATQADRIDQHAVTLTIDVTQMPICVNKIEVRK